VTIQQETPTQTPEQALVMWRKLRDMGDYQRLKFIRQLAGESLMPWGVCPSCDDVWTHGWGPSHTLRPCSSYPDGRRHCTCDSCF
jgi:hypothetical protein